MKKLKLIFLDIDGVLNNVLDGTSYFCLNPNTYGISEKNVKYLENVIDETGAKIVWITSWRNHPDDHEYFYNDMKYVSHFKEINDRLKNHLFEISKCPHIKKSSKSDDIMGFFYLLQERYGLNPEDINYVILDDARNHGLERFNRNFFNTDVTTGLTETYARSISLYLNKEN